MSLISGGLLSRFESNTARLDIEHLLPDQVAVYLPFTTDCTETGCGYDQFTQSGKDPSCLVCNGLGLVTIWRIGHIACRVSWVKDAVLNVYQGIPSGELGDVIIQAPLRDRALLESVLSDGRAYIVVDSKHVRPRSVTVNRLERLTSLDVRCDVVREET